MGDNYGRQVGHSDGSEQRETWLLKEFKILVLVRQSAHYDHIEGELVVSLRLNSLVS